MSDRLVLVQESNEGSSKSSCSSSNSSHVLDGVSYFALGFVLAGLIFTAIGFLYPRDLTRDPNASARENEAVDVEYMQLTKALNAIIITGMVLIAVGGLILAAVFTNTVVCEECHRRGTRDSETRTLTSDATSQRGQGSQDEVTPAQDYGAVSSESVPQESSH